MSTNGAPVAPGVELIADGFEAPAANGDGSHADPRPSEAVYDVTTALDFLWRSHEDAVVAARAGELNCWDWTNPGQRKDRRGRQIVIAHHDTKEGRTEAERIAQECIVDRAYSVRLWSVPEYGSRFATMKDWCATHSLINTVELVCAGKWADFVVFVSGQNQVSPDFSAVDPRPIETELVPVPPLEDAMIPGRWRAWILDIAKRAWIPPDYPMAAAVVALGGLIGRRLAIRPKKKDRWLVVPNIWGGAIGQPGSMKTAAVEEGLRPLKRLAADAVKDHEAAIAAWQERCLVAAAKRQAAKKELEQAAKKKLDDAKLAELARDASSGQDEEQPKAKRYLVNDTTIEKLGELMAENPGGLTLFRDELTGLLKTLEKQGHESDRGFLLECWNGSGSYTFDRIGRGTTHIAAACLAIFGTIQPGPLAKYLRGSISGEEADGFIPRFQLMVYPDANISYLYVDAYVDSDAKNKAYDVFKAVAEFDPAAIGCEVDQDTGLAFVGFDDEAQAFFVEWFTELEKRLRSGTLSAIMASHLSKYRSLFPSLALLFHLIDSVDADGRITRLEPVSLEAAEVAAAWCEYLEAHAHRIYQMASDGDPSDAIRMAEKIKESLPNPFTIRDVQRKGWAGLTGNDDVRRALGVLEDRGWVKVVEVPSADSLGRGRPSEQVWINPKVAAPANGGGS